MTCHLSDLQCLKKKKFNYDQRIEAIFRNIRDTPTGTKKDRDIVLKHATGLNKYNPENIDNAPSYKYLFLHMYIDVLRIAINEQFTMNINKC